MTRDASSALTFPEAVRQLPKIELHCHVEGTMRPATIVELARDAGLRLPTTQVEELFSYGSLTDFLSVFWLVQSVLDSRNDWSRLGYEAVLDGAAAGRVYAEMFFTPARHLAAGHDLADIVAGLAEGVAAGDRRTGATTMLICDMDRAYGPEAGRLLVEELIELRRKAAPGVDRVIGIGMDSTEIGVDPRAYLPAYELAAQWGLRRTGHQGEDSPPSDVAAVVDVLGAERIDHGLSAAHDPELVARFADQRIPLTMCPTSNVVIANRMSSVHAHPFPVLRQLGMLVTLNTDDPSLMGIDLADEYMTCAAAWDWDFPRLIEISVDAVAASWLDDDEARRLVRHIRARGAALDGQLNYHDRSLLSLSQAAAQPGNSADTSAQHRPPTV